MPVLVSTHPCCCPNPSSGPEPGACTGAQLCAGASPEERAAWQLGAAADFHYLNQSSCYELAGVDSADEYKARPAPPCQAMQPMGWAKGAHVAHKSCGNALLVCTFCLLPANQW